MKLRADVAHPMRDSIVVLIAHLMERNRNRLCRRRTTRIGADVLRQLVTHLRATRIRDDVLSSASGFIAVDKNRILFRGTQKVKQPTLENR